MSEIKPPLQSIKTKPSEELRLYSRRLSQSQELSVATDASLDVYYRENPVGIPFLWESQPGTPKIKTREFPLPPLTPPPSFHASPVSRRPARKQPRSNVFLVKLNLKKAQFEESSWSAPLREDDCDSPVSTLCFYGGARGRARGCSASIRRLLLGDLF